MTCAVLPEGRRPCVPVCAYFGDSYRKYRYGAAAGKTTGRDPRRRGEKRIMAKIDFLNIRIDNLTMEEALQQIDKMIRERTSRYIVTPNLDHIVNLEEDAEFAKAYAGADLVLADGTPLLWISKWLKNPIKEKVSGSDLFPRMCQLAAERGYKVFLFGAAKGVAAKAAENLQKQ